MFVLHIRGSGGSNSVMVKKKPLNCYLLFPEIICCQCWFLGCQTYCTFKFYVDDKPTKTESISDTINPDFKFEKKCGYPSVTQGVCNPGYFRRGSRTVWSAMDPTGIFSDTNTCNMILDYEGNVPLVGCICCFKKKTIVLNI